ncbi:aminotransferase class V-fold PLP-dependent enzyme [Mycoplasmopsis fermentans]|uniref:aminotransferase class V-fold PLP-dependent enzyme n=2 Tax=Mycoplasmopsis fermentans TaxID=2115 RepID=UPI000F0215DB|nr:aminotransferase class V-fold PLP-dependent enzyme [Mycoplasmopsis fermentans]RMX34528.1 aminotransferase class-V family protein [Mycoplasmopsis fermentans MF-I2]
MAKVRNAVIFAAGKGTRMTPLTHYVPKPLITVNDESMIERNIKHLQEIGINDITVVVGYMKDQFNLIKEKYNVKLIENDLYDEANNIYSYVVSKNAFGDTLYIEGDLYIEKNIFPEIIKIIENSEDSICFTEKCTKHKSEWVFDTNNKGYVVKHHNEKDAYNQNIWIGILYLNKKLANEAKEKVDAWFNQQGNKQQYFETFLWTLENKMRLEAIPSNLIKELDNFQDLINIDHHYANHASTLLFTPGPINNYPEVSEILSESVLHHRSELFKHYMEESTNLIKEFFRTKEALPLFITCSATGAMEAVVVNLISPENKVLLVEAGDFGKRFQIILERLIGANNLDVIHYEDGEAFKVKDIENKLKENKYDAFFCTHHETSTGVLNDIEAISKVVKKYAKDTLFIVDTVSSFIHENVEFDNWGLDVAIATSGKAFCVMPGLSCVVLSKRAQQVVKANKNFKFYFDLSAYINFYEREKSTPYTPASGILLALNAAMKVIKNQTFKNIRNNKLKIYDYIKKELIAIGFKDVVPKKNITIGLLVLNVPEGVDAIKLRNKIEYNHNIYFELGRGNRRSKQVRIGIPNTIDMEKAKKLVKVIKETLKIKID